jgi:hypothetical protein
MNLLRFASAMLLAVAGCSSSSTPDLVGGAPPGGDADGSSPSSPPDAGIDLRADAGGADAPSATFTPAPHVPWPTIPSRGGHVLDPLRIVSVVAEDDPLVSDLQKLGDGIPSSAWYASFASEYGLAGTPTHTLIRGPHVAAGTSFTEAQMDQYIASAIAAATPPPTPDGHTVYVLYLPPGTVMTVHGAPDTTCAGVPYHTEYGTSGDAMAVLNPCRLSFPTILDKLTIDATHEIAEAATDPSWRSNPAWVSVAADLTRPWTSSIWNEVEMESSAEIGDLCIATAVVENGLALQRVFSNAAARAGGDPCVPALGLPYFDVSPDPASGGWFAVSPGSDFDEPLVGWSTAPTEDWVVYAGSGKVRTGATFPATLASPTTRRFGTKEYATTNNAKPLTVHVTIPADAASGWWGTVALWSWHTTATGAYVAGEDFGHEAVVGFYVP